MHPGLGVEPVHGSQQLLQLLRQGAGLPHRLNAAAHHQELIAADAAGQVARRQGQAEPVGQGGEQAVAHAHAEAFIDRLEPVHVDVEHRHQVGLRPLPQQLGDPADAGGPVRQPGELVVVAGVLELPPQ